MIFCNKNFWCLCSMRKSRIPSFLLLFYNLLQAEGEDKCKEGFYDCDDTYCIGELKFPNCSRLFLLFLLYIAFFLVFAIFCLVIMIRFVWASSLFCYNYIFEVASTRKNSIIMII